jgi:phosphonate transport system substrate-binding protein
LTRKELFFALTWQRNTEPVGAAAADFLRWLGNELGRPILPRVALSYDELLPMFEKGDVDFGWLPPLTYLQLRAKNLARTLFTNQRHGARAWHAVLAVRSGSRHYALDRLQGARAAWVDPHSTTGYVLARLDLASRGVDPTTTFGEERFFGSHDAAARAVFEGRSDVVGTFAAYDGERITRAGFSTQGGAADWRVVLRGREAPSDVLVAHSSVDEALASAIKTALSGAFSKDASARVVRDVLHVDGFREAEDARYAELADAIESARRAGLFPHL